MAGRRRREAPAAVLDEGGGAREADADRQVAVAAATAETNDGVDVQLLVLRLLVVARLGREGLSGRGTWSEETDYSSRSIAQLGHAGPRGGRRTQAQFRPVEVSRVNEVGQRSPDDYALLEPPCIAFVCCTIFVDE